MKVMSALLTLGNFKYFSQNLLFQIMKLPFSPSFVALANEAFGSYIAPHVYRGYVILPKIMDAIFDVRVRVQGQNSKIVKYKNLRLRANSLFTLFTHMEKIKLLFLTNNCKKGSFNT